MTTSATMLAAESEEAHWQQWRLHYVDSSRKTATQMRIAFALTFLTATGLLVRAFF